MYRQVRRSVYSRIEGSGVGVSFMAVGSLVLAIHSVEASVAPAERQTAETGSRRRGPVREPHRLAPKSSTYTPVQSPCVDFALAVVA